MISDVEHLFVYLFSLCRASLKNVSSGLLPIFESDFLKMLFPFLGRKKYTWYIVYFYFLSFFRFIYFREKARERERERAQAG